MVTGKLLQMLRPSQKCKLIERAPSWIRIWVKIIDSKFLGKVAGSYELEVGVHFEVD